MRETLRALVLLGCFLVSCAMHIHFFRVITDDCTRTTPGSKAHGQMYDCTDVDRSLYARNGDSL